MKMNWISNLQIWAVGQGRRWVSNDSLHNNKWKHNHVEKRKVYVWWCLQVQATTLSTAHRQKLHLACIVELCLIKLRKVKITYYTRAVPWSSRWNLDPAFWLPGDTAFSKTRLQLILIISNWWANSSSETGGRRRGWWKQERTLRTQAERSSVGSLPILWFSFLVFLVSFSHLTSSDVLTVLFHYVHMHAFWCTSVLCF